MDANHAMAAFGALAQPTRLAAFRLLMAMAPEGLPAGHVASALGVPHTTLSTHLGILARAGLIRARRESRLVIYAADTDGARAVIGFLLEDCCRGRPEACLPAGTHPRALRRAQPVTPGARSGPSVKNRKATCQS